FLFVQQGSSSVKFSLLGCLLLVGQTDSKLHVVLWWNNVVFFAFQVLGLAVGGSTKVDDNRSLFSRINQAGDELAVFDCMDVQVAQSQGDRSFAVCVGNQSGNREELGVVEQLDTDRYALDRFAVVNDLDREGLGVCIAF